MRAVSQQRAAPDQGCGTQRSWQRALETCRGQVAAFVRCFPGCCSEQTKTNNRICLHSSPGSKPSGFRGGGDPLWTEASTVQ